MGGHLPQSTDESSGSNAPRRAELNPLLNPLLADNMGRWAEVYFKSPPEKRDEAVLALLHRLEAEKRAQGSSPAKHYEDNTSGYRSEGMLESVRCENCGRDNPVTHRFCGKCGAVLEFRDKLQQHSADERYRDEAPPDRKWDTDRPLPHESATPNTNSLSLFQSIPRENFEEKEEEWEYGPAPRNSYRVYVEAVLAVTLLILGYTAWRSMRASQSGDEPSAAPTVTTENKPQPPTPVAGNSAPATPPDTRKSPEEVAPAKGTEPPGPSEKTQPTTPARANAKPASAPTEDASQATPSTGKGNGSDELSTALHYLYGTGGQGTDKAEAAKWLWKAISKHNGPATLVLADLYLKGDGVSKNCDQARVLLDSAARNGVSGAGERLRNMQAFGCQ